MKRLILLLMLLTLSTSFSGCAVNAANPCPKWPDAPESVKELLWQHRTPESIAWGNRLLDLKEKLAVCRGD